MMVNLQHSLSVLPQQDPTAKVVTEQIIKHLRKQISKMEEEITNLSNKEFKRQMELLTSIKGIGENIASALILATGGFTYFSSANSSRGSWGFVPLTSNQVRQLMSKVTLIAMEIHICEALCMSSHFHLLEAILPVKKLTRDCDLGVNPVELQSLLSLTNLLDKLSPLLPTIATI